MKKFLQISGLMIAVLRLLSYFIQAKHECIHLHIIMFHFSEQDWCGMSQCFHVCYLFILPYLNFEKQDSWFTRGIGLGIACLYFTLSLFYRFLVLIESRLLHTVSLDGAEARFIKEFFLFFGVNGQENKEMVEFELNLDVSW